MPRPFVLPLLLAGLLTGCVTAQPPRAPSPLAERIFAGPSGTELSRDELVQRMLAARVVYLGEKHDSDRQHEIQRSLLEEMVARGARPALGLEMFSRDRSGALMGYVERAAPAAGDNAAPSAEDWLRRQLTPDDAVARESTWEAYLGLVETARRHGLVLFGIDLPLSLRARITRVGTSGLSHVERALLSPTGFDDDVYRALMQERFKASHCGFGNDEQLGRLYDNWVARNDTMARAIVAALDDARDGPVVVVVGAGHLEYDMGVVDRVAALVPGIEQVNFAMREVTPDSPAVASQFETLEYHGRRFPPAHRYLWFTAARGEAVDYCRNFPKAMTGASG